MNLTLHPTKKTVAQWESGKLLIAQGNSVIDLNRDQAHELLKFLNATYTPAFFDDGAREELKG